MTLGTLQLHNSRTEFRSETDGLLMVHRQEIDAGLMDHLLDERIASATVRSKDYHRVAAIPTQIVDIWVRQGRPFWAASAKEIVGWLQKDGLDAFIGTNKRI